MEQPLLIPHTTILFQSGPEDTTHSKNATSWYQPSLTSSNEDELYGSSLTQ